MDEESGYCIGCGRTIEEISGWGSATPEVREQTLAQLPERGATMAAPGAASADENKAR